MQNQLLTNLDNQQIMKFINLICARCNARYMNKCCAYEEVKDYLRTYSMSSDEYESYIRLLTDLLDV